MVVVEQVLLALLVIMEAPVLRVEVLVVMGLHLLFQVNL